MDTEGWHLHLASLCIEGVFLFLVGCISVQQDIYIIKCGEDALGPLSLSLSLCVHEVHGFDPDILGSRYTMLIGAIEHGCISAV